MVIPNSNHFRVAEEMLRGHNNGELELDETDIKLINSIKEGYIKNVSVGGKLREFILMAKLEEIDKKYGWIL